VGTTLDIRLLGCLEVRRGGDAVPLPPSRRARALLGYLVAEPQPHLRSQLCDLLFEGPDDPRASLRWSLSKTRSLLGEAFLPADRDQVAFEAHDATVDLRRLREGLASGVARTPTPKLREIVSLFRGGFLDGLELPDCYRYHQWWLAERATFRAQHTEILGALVERLCESEPEESLRFARARVVLDPLAEEGHLALVRLHAAAGHTKEALAQYETCRRILEKELGARPSPALESLRQGLGGARPAGPRKSSERPSLSLVGRKAEQRALAEAVSDARAGRPGGLVLLVGEPGLGKSRLLGHLAGLVESAGGRVLTGRAFEAEMVRPYGPWVDALRWVPSDEVPLGLRADLAPLLPELGARPATDSDRNRLFDAVARLLFGLGPGSPTLLLLDDIQWFDEVSAALLHYVVRSSEASRLLVAVAARPGELEENQAASRLLRTLRAEGRLREHRLAPLVEEETAELARSVDPEIDGEHVFAESGGNPLFALEVARAGLGGGQAGTLDALIGDRLARLDPEARELVKWASALGRAFDLPTLQVVTGVPLPGILGGCQDLERHGVFRVTGATEAGYDFAHDLVRRVAYRSLPGPARKVVHLQIARALEGLSDPDGILAGDVAHHAAQGDDALLASRACVRAGERCVRMYAPAEAIALAEAGMRQLDRVPPSERLGLHLDLLGVFVHSGAGQGRIEELEKEIAGLIAEAEKAGDGVLAQKGYYLISFLQYHSGAFDRAQAYTLQALEAGRSHDTTAVRALANTGRCLSLLGRDMERARGLLEEAAAKLVPGSPEGEDVYWGLGLVHHHAGEHEKARGEFEQALELCRKAGDHWTESDCLARLVMIALEERRAQDALETCAILIPVADKMGEGSEAPFARALEALARLFLSEKGAEAEVEKALRNLRDVDSKWMLAYSLVLAGEADLARGDFALALGRAREAQAAARAVDRPSELALAFALEARTCLALGGREAAQEAWNRARGAIPPAQKLSQRAREALERSAPRP
jgi:DNA-binding SARP family transcriptional activator/tetratricopeptide (TPR) repeat protein